jgi:hypothetical protein
MSEMIERVARALCKLHGLDPDEESPSVVVKQMAGYGAVGSFSGPPESHWRAYVPVATAAIEAMREPTEAMINAAYSSDPLSCDVEFAKDVYPPIWNGMINEALK